MPGDRVDLGELDGTIPVETVSQWMTCTSRCSEPLRSFRQQVRIADIAQVVVKLITRLLPAPTTIVAAIEQQWWECGGDPAGTAGGVDGFHEGAEKRFGREFSKRTTERNLSRLRKQQATTTAIRQK
jgi:hypothetical protein